MTIKLIAKNPPLIGVIKKFGRAVEEDANVFR
jgi:hypothetical protein